MATEMKRTQVDLKIIILGDHSVGKTSFIQRYLNGTFVSTSSTLGASLVMKKWGSYNVAIWDTAGEERFAAISNFYTRGSHAAILAYDITNEQSFQRLKSTFVAFLKDAKPNCLCVVVGMKKDLTDNSNDIVSIDDARQLALKQNENKCIGQSSKLPIAGASAYFETSSKTGENIEKVFLYIQKILTPELPTISIVDPSMQSIRLDSNTKSKNPTKDEKQCC